MPPDERKPKDDLEGAVLALLHSYDNQRTPSQWLNLAVDWSIPHTFADQLERLDRAELERRTLKLNQEGFR